MPNNKAIIGLLTSLVFAGIFGCTLKKQETPSLTGPSELGTSITVTASPDVLAQDGASQAVITILARDASGQPLRSTSLHVEITLNGVIADFGTLSARNVVTDQSGRATLVYTAPSAPAVAVDTGTVVSIQVTPTGTDFGNTTPRVVSIRLVPPGVVAPPDGLNPSFTVTPTNPAEGDNVLFDASASTSNAQNPITSYSWSFGDGGAGSGVVANHTFTKAGNPTVTLTVGDAFGRSRSLSKQITVGAGARPTADFVFSPNPPKLNQAIHFNASGSTPPPGRRIVSYNWDFGDGIQISTANVTIDHTYTAAGTYVATLTVTDDQGKTSPPASKSITPQ